MSEMETENVSRENGERGGQRLTRAVEETVERLGYECVHVGMKGGPHGLSLEVLIDSLGGITVDDCETVSKSLNRMLDGANFPELEGRYYLEVSSPGVERPLFTMEQYGRFLGREARLRLQEPLEGRKSLTGTISAAEGEGVTLYVAEEERDIFVPFHLIKGGNLVYRPDGQPTRTDRSAARRRSAVSEQDAGRLAEVRPDAQLKRTGRSSALRRPAESEQEAGHPAKARMESQGPRKGGKRPSANKKKHREEEH